MENEDLPSDSEQSDVDFCPEDVDSEDLSEEGSDYDELEDKNEENQSVTDKKQSRKKQRVKKRTKGESKTKEAFIEEVEPQAEPELDEESEKKRSDELWASFLSDTNDTPKESRNAKPPESKINSSDNKISITKSPEPIRKVKVTEIFEFAGEEVKVTKEIPENEIPMAKGHKNVSNISNLPTPSRLSRGPVKRPSAGLSSVLNSIGKKGKISVLEKTKLDWDGFKQKEGLSEELQTFNKGKDGYLERQDFLERTDLKQFELEKNMRKTRRSNR